MMKEGNKGLRFYKGMANGQWQRHWPKQWPLGA